MSGAIHPLPQYAFTAWCSVKAQGQLYLYLYLNLNFFVNAVLICYFVPKYFNFATFSKDLLAISTSELLPSRKLIFIENATNHLF
jgi:hypothetical protein